MQLPSLSWALAGQLHDFDTSGTIASACKASSKRHTDAGWGSLGWVRPVGCSCRSNTVSHDNYRHNGSVPLGFGLADQ